MYGDDICILQCDNFNATTSRQHDYVMHDNEDHLPLPCDYHIDIAVPTKYFFIGPTSGFSIVSTSYLHIVPTLCCCIASTSYLNIVPTSECRIVSTPLFYIVSTLHRHIVSTPCFYVVSMSYCHIVSTSYFYIVTTSACHIFFFTNKKLLTSHLSSLSFLLSAANIQIHFYYTLNTINVNDADSTSQQRRVCPVGYVF